MSASANRYARALFDVALQEQADLAKIDRDLTVLAEVVHEHHEMLLQATRHGVPDEARQSVIGAIADKLEAAPPLRKMLLVLALSQKLSLVPGMVQAFRARLHAHQNVLHADVTSASPLSPEQTRALAVSLGKVTGKNVNLSVSVDPALMGGVVATVGSTVYDGSVRTQLARLRQELVK
ncbi:MAG: synthase delta chain [Acidobacteriota bacterium]|jgi:F-type H+-transporting ATPase subunit delta